MVSQGSFIYANKSANSPAEKAFYNINKVQILA